VAKVKWLAVLLFWVIPLIAQAQFPTTPILDNFNRADEDPIAGIWSDDLFGTGIVGCEVDTNQLVKSGTGDTDAGCWVNEMFPADQEVYVTLPNASSHGDNTSFYLYVCLHNTPGTVDVDGYALQFRKRAADTDVISLHKMTGSSVSQVGSNIDQEVLDNEEIGFSIAADGTLTAWHDGGGGWTSIGTESGTSYNCNNTQVGLRVSVGNHIVDDVGGGSATTSLAPFTIILFQ
jgi:hypothetical protein